MTLRDQLASAGATGPSVVAIGTFDGVHLGHQRLIREVVTRARARAAEAVIVTFHPRPAEVLRPDEPSQYLCSLDRRVATLRSAGADRVAVVGFDLALSQMAANQFCSTLVDQLGMEELVGGPDLALGHRREGTPDVLARLGGVHGFSVSLVPAFTLDGEVIRTSVIRRLVTESDLPRAERLLGRRYAVDGIVVKGEGRGSTIGIPTANVQTADKLVLPANGVYAVYFGLGGRRYAGAANLGLRPTFGGTTRSLEIHLLDFAGDLYGQSCEVAFVARLRAEQRFANVTELVAQIRRDVAATRQLLV